MSSEAKFSSDLRKEMFKVYCVQNTRPYINLIQDSYNSGKKPFDFFVTFRRKFYALELKICKQLSINFDMVKPHQVASLKKIKMSGKNFESHIIIWLYKYDKTKALMIPVRVWEIILEKYTGKKSVKITELINFLQEHVATYRIVERTKIDGITRWQVEKIIEHNNTLE